MKQLKQVSVNDYLNVKKQKKANNLNTTNGSTFVSSTNNGPQRKSAMVGGYTSGTSIPDVGSGDTNTSTSTNTNTSGNSSNIYGNDLYQEYLNSVASTARAKGDMYANKINSMKYANDMLKSTGYASTGLAQSTDAGIMNNYLNAMANLNANQYNTERQIQVQSSANALNAATEQLSNGMKPEDILATYGQYLNEQDKTTLDAYINQAKQLEEDNFFATYGVNKSTGVDPDTYLWELFNSFTDYEMTSEERAYANNQINKMKDSNYNGFATKIGDWGFWVIYNGKLYEISPEAYEALKQQGKTIGDITHK